MTGDTAEIASWLEATRVDAPERPRLNFDLDVDVCVIGAGLAGLTAAREVARRGWSVAVLEAGRVGWAASGRNTGFVLPGFSEGVETMVERIGLDHTRKLWALSEEGVAYVRNTISETQMPGVTPVDGWLKVSKIDDTRAVTASVERLRWMGTEVEAWPTERVREQLPSERYFDAMYFPRAFHLHALNYTLGLARAAEAAGVRFFEETPAISLDPSGIRKRVQTPSARVRAAHVVLAGNVHLGALMPRLAATLVPLTTYVMVTEPIRVLPDVVRYRGAVSDAERGGNHYRIVDNDRLQWAGGITVREINPRRFARTLTASVRRIFPQLGEIKIAHLWSGTLGRSIHRMPQIGEIQRGLWVASAFGGHGLNTTAIAGDLIARGIVENDQTWRLFAPYELVWAGGRIGKLAAQAIYTGSRPIVAVKEAAARYRERARRRKQEKLEARRKVAPPPATPGESPSSVPADSPVAPPSQQATAEARAGPRE